MRAVVLRTFGPPDRLVVEDVADPLPEAGQALVAVEFASLTFVETQVRAGAPPNPAMTPRLPAVLGNGVGGIVTTVGEGIDGAVVGRRVVTTTGGSGGYAEQVAVDAAELIEVPDDLGMADAVALLADGRTAIGLIDLAAVRHGDTVLVEAAAGGVGGLLVQLARRAGATVVGVAGAKRKVAHVTQLGADVAIDYSHPGWDAKVRAHVGSVGVVFDGIGGEIGRAGLELLGPNGRFLPYGMASGAFTEIPGAETTRRGITVLRAAPRAPGELRVLTRRALAEAAAGRLRAVIGQTYPLERAADAHAAIAARQTIGKTLLRASPTTHRVDL
ncbi:MAG: NADPH:quinone reductase [Pseudonocardiales bacterium]|nr:NADPH:quinone reductase [Pseudonocardiales bacterium]